MRKVGGAGRAAQLLIQLINGEPVAARAQRVVLPPELVVRNSCGARPVIDEKVKWKVS